MSNDHNMNQKPCAGRNCGSTNPNLADGLTDKERHSALIHKMNLAADLLMKVWEKEQEQT